MKTFSAYNCQVVQTGILFGPVFTLIAVMPAGNVSLTISDI
jgi:hypothetical protein